MRFTILFTIDSRYTIHSILESITSENLRIFRPLVLFEKEVKQHILIVIFIASMYNAHSKYIDSLGIPVFNRIQLLMFYFYFFSQQCHKTSSKDD